MHWLAAPERVVAVDVPSGLDGDAGKPLGETCFRAVLTVTFVRKKPAHVLMPGRALCGEVVVADIGAPEAVVAAQSLALWENAPHLWSVPWPGPEAHKHEQRHVLQSPVAGTPARARPLGCTRRTARWRRPRHRAQPC